MGRVAGDKEGEWQLMSTGLLSRVMKMFWVSKLKKKKKLELYALKCRPQWYVNYMSIFKKQLLKTLKIKIAGTLGSQT